MSDLTDRLRNLVEIHDGRTRHEAIAEAADLIDKIDARHRPETVCGSRRCGECLIVWPCRTHRLIHPEADHE